MQLKYLLSVTFKGETQLLTRANLCKVGFCYYGYLEKWFDPICDRTLTSGIKLWIKVKT